MANRTSKQNGWTGGCFLWLVAAAILVVLGVFTYAFTIKVASDTLALVVGIMIATGIFIAIMILASFIALIFLRMRREQKPRSEPNQFQQPPIYIVQQPQPQLDQQYTKRQTRLLPYSNDNDEEIVDVEIIGS